jgi:hypothetical protein
MRIWNIAIKLSLFGGINNVLYKSGDKTSQDMFEKFKALPFLISPVKKKPFG